MEDQRFVDTLLMRQISPNSIRERKSSILSVSENRQTDTQTESKTENNRSSSTAEQR